MRFQKARRGDLVAVSMNGQMGPYRIGKVSRTERGHVVEGEFLAGEKLATPRSAGNIIRRVLRRSEVTAAPLEIAWACKDRRFPLAELMEYMLAYVEKCPHGEPKSRCRA